MKLLKNNPTTIRRNGNPVVPTFIDTIVSRPNEVTAGSTTLDLRNTVLAEAPSLTRASSLGMYVDTSGRQFTNPIQGLEHLTNLKEVNLIYGIEATNYTYTMELDIIKPCNITKVVTEQERKIIEAVTKAFQRVKPIITFPKDMSSLIINNKRELIKEIGLNLWKTVANNTQVAEELNNDVPTLDETVRQTMEQFGEGNALFDELDIICPGLKHLRLLIVSLLC